MVNVCEEAKELLCSMLTSSMLNAFDESGNLINPSAFWEEAQEHCRSQVKRIKELQELTQLKASELIKEQPTIYTSTIGTFEFWEKEGLCVLKRKNTYEVFSATLKAVLTKKHYPIVSWYGGIKSFDLACEKLGVEKNKMRSKVALHQGKTLRGKWQEARSIQGWIDIINDIKDAEQKQLILELRGDANT